MTAPYTLPPQKKERNPFDDLPDIAPPKAQAKNPFDELPDLSAASLEKERHAKILRDNEEGRAKDRASAPTFREQVRSGVGDVFDAVRHPIDTVVGMGKSAAHDINLSMGERIPKAGELGAVPSDLTPEQQHELPKAIANTMMLAATPILPTGSLVTRTAVNAGLGAMNTPDQPLRGATAGAVLGEVMHQAPGLVPERIAKPAVRLGQTSEALKAGEFRRTLGVDDVAAATAPVAVADHPVVEPLPGVERLAPAQPPKTTPRAPKGLEVNPFDELPDLAGKQKPVATEAVADVVAKEAGDRQFVQDLEKAVTPDPELVAAIPEEIRAEDLTRQAALRALTGRKRRPAGAKPEEVAPPSDSAPAQAEPRGNPNPDGWLEVLYATKPEHLDVSEPLHPTERAAIEAEYQDLLKAKARQEARGRTLDETEANGLANAEAVLKAQPEPLPSYPEGFAMGGPEGRIPGKGELPKIARGKAPEPVPEPLPEPVAVEPVKGLEQTAPPPDPWADWVDQEPAPQAETPTIPPSGIVPPRRVSTIDLEAQQEAARVRPDSTPGAPDPYEIPLNRGGLASIEGTGETKTRGLSLGVAEKAIANRLTESLGELPEYKTMNVADQAAKAAELLASNPARARRVALGEEAPPVGLHPEAAFIAVENHALATGDVATLHDLAHGELTKAGTTMGQRLRLLAERDPESPVAAIQSVADAREKGLGKQTSKQVEEMVKQGETHVTQIAPTAWADFINSIRC